MRATESLRPLAAAREVPPQMPQDGGTLLPPLPALARTAPRARRVRAFLTSALVLAVLWGALTGWRADAWVMGAPAVILGASLGLLLPDTPRWRISPRGAVVFLIWFALQSVRGAVDVSRRAFSPAMPLRPGFRTHPLRLPQGPARVLFVNTITLLPGTLSAEIQGDTILVHMLDTRADLVAELTLLETRIRALFALPPVSEISELS